MKKQIKLTATLLSLLLAGGCVQQPAAAPVAIPKPVEVKTVQEETRVEESIYFGVAQSDVMKKMSFRSNGRVKTLHVQVGQKIESGMLLASLDDSDLATQVKITRDQIDVAQQDIVKAKEQLTYLTQQQEKIKALVKAGAATQDQLDSVTMNVETGQAALRQAYSQVELLRNQLSSQEDLLEDGQLYADMDGTVINIPVEAGELVAAGTPVVVLRSTSESISFSVPQKDLAAVDVDQRVRLVYEGHTLEGTIQEVKDIPDPYTRGYAVEASVLSGQIPVGAAVEVYVPLGVSSGYWVPVSAIMTTSTDYVLVHEDGAAVRKNVIIQQLSGDVARVTGLQDGDQVIVAGFGTLRAGKQVTIKGEK